MPMFADAVFLFVILMLLVGAIQLYSRRFSGISQRPYKHIYGGAPGASGPSRMSRSDERDLNYWTRGTR
jgi:hypothetical protein